MQLWGTTLAKGKHFEKELTYGSPFVILASAAFFLVAIPGLILVITVLSFVCVRMIRRCNLGRKIT